MALYDEIGRGYAGQRQPDPRIAALINAALGDAENLVNIGAGTGSYEPADRSVIAVEPSDAMIAQRPAGAAPCLKGVADDLPLADASVDAAMAILSVHHWPDMLAGLKEMRRVARRRVLLLTWVPDSPDIWLTRNYFPEIRAHDEMIFPTSDSLAAMMATVAGPTRIVPVPIPHDCVDGFLCAYWRRPHAYLDRAVRAGMSSFSRFDATAGLERLALDLDSGQWQARNADLLDLPEIDAGYRIVVAEIGG